MRFVSIRRIGIILLLLGILIGFFELSIYDLGSISFPFSNEIARLVSEWSLGMLDYTGSWWNNKLWIASLTTGGLLLIKFG